MKDDIFGFTKTSKLNAIAADIPRLCSKCDILYTMSKYEPHFQDYHAFLKATSDDVFWAAGNYNLFMMCETPNQSAFRELPDGYSFRLCGRDELETWKRVAVEEPYVDSVSEYYEKLYAKHEDEFFRRCTFVCNPDGKPVATCFLWRSYGKINTIGWFRTLPEYEGKGLGRALLSRILKNAEYPVYLHTQPTSVRAIKLYSDFGFKLITDPIVGFHKNDLSESLPILQKVMPEADYAALQTVKADTALLEAALSSEMAEF